MLRPVVTWVKFGVAEVVAGGVSRWIWSLGESWSLWAKKNCAPHFGYSVMASVDLPSQPPIANISPTNYAGQQIRQVIQF